MLLNPKSTENQKMLANIKALKLILEARSLIMENYKQISAA
jgi:hypothetical protein